MPVSRIGAWRFRVSADEEWAHELDLADAAARTAYPIVITGREPNDAPQAYAHLGETAEWRGAQVCGRIGTESARFALATPEVGPHRIGFRQATQEAIYAVACWRVIRAGGLVLHAATVRVDDEVVVVMGDSGAGKSTLCRRLPGHFLHEEHAFLVPRDGRWWCLRAESSWYGTGLAHPWEAPVRRLLILGPERDHTATRALSTEASVSALFRGLIQTPGMPMESLLDALVTLANTMGVHTLSHCLETPPQRVLQVLAGDAHVA